MLSVIICTHNPNRDHLRRTLLALSGQSLPKSQWELLVIDNASAEPLATTLDLSWHPSGRVVREEELGLTAARMRGIRDSSGNRCVFVDDDNVLEPGYLETAGALMDAHPTLGCIGAGRILPEFEEPPEEDLRLYTNMLALRQVDRPRWSNDPADACVPWGAGLVLTREVAIAHERAISSSLERHMLGRKGDSLNACEDDEFSWTACSMGLGKGIFPELGIIHLISARRVKRDYLLKLAEGHTYSRALLHWIHRKTIPDQGTPPSGALVLKAFLTGSVSVFFSEGDRWWKNRAKSRTTIAFESAWSAGRNKAAAFLTETSRQQSKSADS